MLDLKEDTMKKDHKIKELDSEVKKWRNEFVKLETTSYTKEAEYVRKVKTLEVGQFPFEISFFSPESGVVGTRSPPEHLL